MHELSIAGAIVDVAERHADGRRVMVVWVRIGHLRQVVPSALELAFELLTQGTTLQGARLEVEEVPPAGSCERCGHAGPLDALPPRCRACGALEVRLTAGEELSVQEIEVETRQEVAVR